jgi:hypothetical protein
MKLIGNPIYSKHEGTPLKTLLFLAITSFRKEKRLLQIWTRGNSIYGLSPQIRKQLDTNSKASIFIDFKPSLTLENIHSKIKLSKYRSTTDILKRT